MFTVIPMQKLHQTIKTIGSRLRQDFSTPQSPVDQSKGGTGTYVPITSRKIREILYQSEILAHNTKTNSECSIVIVTLVKIIRQLLQQIEYMEYGKDTRD